MIIQLDKQPGLRGIARRLQGYILSIDAVPGTNQVIVSVGEPLDEHLVLWFISRATVGTGHNVEFMIRQLLKEHQNV